MKFTVYMKDPDSLYESIRDALAEDAVDLGLPQDELEVIRDLRYEKAIDIAKTWFEYSEYVTIEIDTDEKTARVVPVSEKRQ